MSPSPIRAAAVIPLSPVTDADGRLGLCDVLPGGPNGAAGPSWAQLAYNAGARVNRWEFRWDRIEASGGKWSFNSDDAAVRSSRSAGLDVLGILIGTPGWAAAAGQKPGNGVPNGLYLPYNDPRNLWADYVRNTVAHYAGQVAYWEIWNEPDLAFFWSGTSEDYFRLLKVAYLTITQTDPEARVLTAGMVSPDMSFLGRLLNDAHADPGGPVHHGYFDGVSWHQYGPASRLFANIGKIKSMLAADALGAPPIWITEDGFPSSNPNGEARQAAYVEQTIAYAFAAGASRLLFYRASDDTQATKWGLLSATGLVREGYVAFQVAASTFAHMRSVVYAPAGNLERFSLYGRGQHTTMLWSRTGSAEATALPASPNAIREDWQGAQSPAPISNGRIHVTAPSAMYNVGVDPASSVVGGPPLFVHQYDTPPERLPQRQYVPPVTGGQRKLVLVNATSAPVLLQVGATGLSAARSLVQVGPRATQLVDLDLLAGTKYAGSFRISSQLPLSTQAVSGAGVGSASVPSTSWDVPAAPGGLQLVNTSRRPVAAGITAYGPKGSTRAVAPLELAAAASYLWQPPVALEGTRLSFHVTSERPILVVGPAPSSALPPAAKSTWYALRPAGRPIVVFNPDVSGNATLKVRSFGGPAPSVTQYRIAPHGNAVVRAGQESTDVLTANQAVVAQYADATGGSALTSSDATHSVYALGRSTKLDFFNPQDVPAHLAITILTSGKSRTSTITIGPRATETVPVADSNGYARGIVVDSDVLIASQERG